MRPSRTLAVVPWRRWRDRGVTLWRKQSYRCGAYFMILVLVTVALFWQPREFGSLTYTEFLIAFRNPASAPRPTTPSETTFDTVPQRPQKLRVVFVGDSLSRYMYLSLVFYLKHGHWAPAGHQLLEKVKDAEPTAWNKWLEYTHAQLDTEMCDCYRYWTNKFKWYNHCENRYFFHQQYHVAFITKIGGNPFHGHVTAPEVFASYGMNQTKSAYKWVHSTWAELVDDYVAQWNPKPDIFLFNQGHWKGHELRDKKVLQALQDVLRKHNIRGIYRTTTYRQDEREDNEVATIAAFGKQNTRQHDNLACQYFECLNVSWTAGISTTEYVDPVHFKSSINNRMNQQFLDALESA